MKFFFGLIPAKKKSYRINKKNFLKYKGKTLYEIAIDNALLSNINQVFVSSDSKIILNYAKKKGASPILRKKKFCKKNTTANLVIKSFINQIKNYKKKNIFLVYLQPTSPLRKPKHINEAINIFLKDTSSTLVSCYENNNQFLKSIIFNSKFRKFIPLFKNFFNENDQNLPKIFMPNGAIYIFSLKNFLKYNGIPLSKIKVYEMKKKESIDINTKNDLKLLNKF